MSKKVLENDPIEETPEVNGNVAAPEVETPAPALATTPIYTITEEPSAAKDKAYSIVFDKSLNKWVAVEILFNFAAGTLGGVRVIEQNVNKHIIAERFQVLVGQNLL